jgi:hypothetical protein
MRNCIKKMNKAISIAALLIFAYQASVVIGLEPQNEARKSRLIEMFPIPNMLARIDAAEIVEGSVMGTEIKYTITNLTKEKVTRISLVAMVFNKRGEFIRSEGLTYGEDLSVSESKEFSYNYLEKEVKQKECLVIAIHAIVGETGTWEVSLDKLEAAIKAYVSVLSEADKAELYRKTLEDVIKNEELIKYLSIEDASNIILSTQDIDPKLTPQIDGVNIRVMTPEEILKKRMQEGIFGFFYFYPLNIEGARVQVSIMYRKDRQVGQNAYTPCCGALDVIFHKEKDKWIEEYSMGGRV